MTPGEAVGPRAPARAPGRRPSSWSSSRITSSFSAVVALAEVDVAHATLAIQKIRGRPVLVLVRVPDRLVVVLDDWIAKVVLGDRVAHVRLVALERELGRVHADDHEPGLPVALVPRLEIRQRADAVDAGIGPEVDEHGMAAQLGERERSPAGGVEPALSCPRNRARCPAPAAGLQSACGRARLSGRRSAAQVGQRSSPRRSPRAPSTGSRGTPAGRWRWRVWKRRS